MEGSILDIILVVSLTVIAVSFVVFLAYFTPVLIQLARTLEEVKDLIALYRKYSEEIATGLNKVANNIDNKVNIFSSNVSSATSFLGNFMSAVFKEIKDSLKYR